VKIKFISNSNVLLFFRVNLRPLLIL